MSFEGGFSAFRVGARVLDIRRRAHRAGVKIPVTLRQRSPNYFSAELADLSPDGFCLFYTGNLSADYDIMVRIPGFAPLTACIRWRRGDQYGCEFIHSLYPAVFDHIVQHLSQLQDIT